MITVLPEFLDHDTAWDLACNADVNPAHWWEHTFKYGSKGETTVRRETVNSYRYDDRLNADIKQSIQNKYFTYRFRRTTQHGEACPCWECNFRRDVLESESFLDVIREHTSLKNPVLYETFTSFYGPGDFLGQHTDHHRGCAFIFHLSWDWKPEWGGLFHVDNQDGTWKTYVPGWGDLVLMELGETGQNHFVSEVSELAQRPRLAISGWYNEG